MVLFESRKEDSLSRSLKSRLIESSEFCSLLACPFRSGEAMYVSKPLVLVKSEVAGSRLSGIRPVRGVAGRELTVVSASLVLLNKTESLPRRDVLTFTVSFFTDFLGRS